MRILSLLPAATEMVYLLGLEDQLVGVTHECDYPAQAALKPRVTRTSVDASLNGSAINQLVQEHARNHRSIYQLDTDLIGVLKPDLILTQEICDVCAVSREQAEETARQLYGTPKVVSLEPSTLAAVLENISFLGELSGRQSAAVAAVSRLNERMETVRAAGGPEARRVAGLEWLQPPLVAGHWLPEMIEMAGGRDILGRAGEPSHPISWDDLREADPEVLLVAPCGFDLKRGLEEYRSIEFPFWWQRLPAVREGRVFAIDGNAYTSRPGPRLVDGLEIITTILNDRPLTTTTYGVDYVRIVPA